MSSNPGRNLRCPVHGTTRNVRYSPTKHTYHCHKCKVDFTRKQIEIESTPS